jgi:hypothetical protein
VTVTIDGSPSEAMIENVSTSGLLLKTSGFIRPGSALRIDVPSRGGAPVVIEGVVVRGAPLGRYGIAFMSLGSEQLELLTRLLPA